MSYVAVVGRLYPDPKKHPLVTGVNQAPEFLDRGVDQKKEILMQRSEEKWPPGMQVRLIHDPFRIGIVANTKPFVRQGKRLFQVRFPGSVERVYEDQLEPLPEERMNPLDLLTKGKLGTPEDLRRTLTHVRLTGQLADIIYSMEATNTDFHAYQFKPVLKLLRTPTDSLLIADEVGLGKTIEAGLIWTELRSRFNLKRLIVLCPAALREKWHDELANKMGVYPQICDAKETLKILQDVQAQERGFAIVSSIQGLRPPRGWDKASGVAPDAAKLARFLESMEHEERLVDLLVIDEAHHLRNPETQANRLGHLMRNVSQYFVLLTATPIHNYNRDLFSLLRLLDPDTFGQDQDFNEILNANAPLLRARDLVLKGASAKELKSALREAMHSRLLEGNRQLEALLSGITETTLTPSERSRIAGRLETVNLLGHTVTRTRKRDVQEWRVLRVPGAKFIPMRKIERKFYDFVTDIVIDYASERAIHEGFLLVTPQRQMASCMPAALKSWKERRVEIPEAEHSWTDRNDSPRQQLGPLTTRLVDRSDEFVDFEMLATNDSKYDQLSTMLRDFFEKEPQSKVIVFSTFRGTLAYLSDRLDQDGISSIVLQGGGSRTKDDIIQEFRSSDGPDVLLSSEVGGEGVDLQFCWIVINYDLPWNPMRVEQRIGRVDRLGQKSDKVLIRSLFYDDTVDARIYQRLYDKLDLCRNALGDFEAILGEKIKHLTRDLLTRHLSPQQQQERIDQTKQALETLKHVEENLEGEAAHLVAYGDYILKQVQAARRMHRWINGADLFAYVTDFLNVHYPGYQITETDGENYEFALSLTVKAKHDLSEFVQRKNLHQSKLLHLARPVPCRFENRVFAGHRTNRETISQFHPLVRFISHQISESETQTRPAVSVRILRENLNSPFAPGIYVVAISLWSIRGLRDVEKLVYEAILLDDPSELLGQDRAEALANTCASKGKRWLEAKHVCDLNQVQQIANDYLFGTLDRRFQYYVEEERAENEDRADIQERNLERNISRQKESIRRTIETHREEGRTKLIPANEGRLRALEDRYQQKKLSITSRRRVTGNHEDIGIALALIEK